MVNAGGIVIVWLSMCRVCFGDLFPSIILVVIEMSIFCGCEFINHPFGSSLEMGSFERGFFEA